MIKKIYVIGAGAIGSLIGGYLTQTYGKNNVCLVDIDREHVDAIRKNKLRINNQGKQQEIDVNILFPDEVNKKDLEHVILSTKAYSNQEVLSYLQDSMNILILQNGYDENLEKLPNAVRGIEFGFACQVKQPGLIYNAVEGRYVLGKLNQKIDSDVDFWQETFNQPGIWNETLSLSGIPTETTSNIEAYLWSKLLINSALNPVSAITGYSLKAIVENKDSRKLFTDIYRESYAVVKKKTAKLASFIGPPKLINRLFKYPSLSKFALSLVAKKFGDVESSMLQDVRKGRKTEIDYINGIIINLGKQFSIETPLNNQIYSLVKEIEQGKEISPQNISRVINPQIEVVQKLNKNDIDKTIAKRRSIRDFSEKEIENKELISLIEAATLAPSALNSQPWKFLIIKSQKRKQKIRETYDNATRKLKLLKKLHLTKASIYDQDTSFLEKSTLIIPCYDRKIKFARDSVCFATENLMLQATQLGLASCCTARTLSLPLEKRKIRKILDMPTGYEPAFIVAVGYPKNQKEYKPPKRKPLEEIIIIR